MGVLLSLIMLRFVLVVGVCCYCWYCQRLNSPLEENESVILQLFKKVISLILLTGLLYANYSLSLKIPSYKVFLDPTLWLPAIITVHYTINSIPLWLRIFITSALLCLWVIMILSLYD